MKKLHNKKGFTLMELLIVIAIIAVLVAVGVPTFTAQLEKSREATDLANIRGAYAEVKTKGMTEEYEEPITLTLQQKKQGWVIDDAETTLNKLATVDGAPQDGDNTATVSWDAEEKTVLISFDGAAAEEDKFSGLDATGKEIKDLATAILEIIQGRYDYSTDIMDRQYADSGIIFHGSPYTDTYRGNRFVDPYTVHLSYSDLNRLGPGSKNNAPVTYATLLQSKGYDASTLEKISKDTDAYIYFNDKSEPLSISYKDGSTYHMIYLDSGNTVEYSNAADRFIIAYYEDYGHEKDISGK